MKILIAVLALVFLLPVVANSITFEWDSVVADDLAGYRLYMSPTSNTYTAGHLIEIPVGTTTVTVVIPNADLYFVCTAFDTNNNESEHSNEIFVAKVVDTEAPPAPTN
jgi:hypothetical protein